MLKTASLTPKECQIINAKATEYPGSGIYNEFNQDGTYLCRQCGLALFNAKHKFHSGCGWPSFDQEIDGNVKREPDEDGSRVEILCNRCDAHLGHVFYGEGYTALSTRHCVNSLALDFVPYTNIVDTEEAIVAAGCFWGVEYYLQRLEGVLKTQAGYSGGTTQNPTYKEVCSNNSGHLEVVRVIYNPAVLSYANLLKYFFEIHDPTQANGQGPDIGPQYLSAIFYYNSEQLQIARQIIQLLQQLQYNVVTQLYPVHVFWPAEEYHQNYYALCKKEPYCHLWQKKFTG